MFGLLGFAYMSQTRYVSAGGAYQQALVFEPRMWISAGLVKCAWQRPTTIRHWRCLMNWCNRIPAGQPLDAPGEYLHSERQRQSGDQPEVLRRLGKATRKACWAMHMTQEARDLALSRVS